jgi:hypothetical protein
MLCRRVPVDRRVASQATCCFYGCCVGLKSEAKATKLSAPWANEGASRVSRSTRRIMPVVGIFFAIDRCHVSWIFIKIRPPDSQLLAVRVNPFPQTFASNESLRACLALYADKVSSKPVTVAPAQASTMV